MFDHHPDREWDGPFQEAYEAPYRAATLAAVDVDDDVAANTITDICEAYWSSWLAMELGPWTPGQLNYRLYKLAHATVGAYTQDQPFPDRGELDRMLVEIADAIERREENERQWREEEKARRAAVARGEPPVPKRARRRGAAAGSGRA